MKYLTTGLLAVVAFVWLAAYMRRDDYVPLIISNVYIATAMLSTMLW